MQQYRVNYVLLIVLFVVGVIGSGAAYGLWRFQMTRHADVLHEAANEAAKQGDVRTVVQYLSSYVSFQPEDTEARVQLANAYADLSELDDVGYDEMGKALRALEESVRKMPNEKELQLRLVKLYGRVGRIADSLDHLGYMLDRDPDNGELLALKAQYLMQEGSDNESIECAYRVVGYDEDSDTFDAQKAKAPGSVSTYAGLASQLHTQRDEKDLAERVMNQMIKANPDSAEAFLTRGRYFISSGQRERGEQDIEQAYELDPENADVLLALAGVSSDEEQDDKAREYIEIGKEKHPEDGRFYQALASLEMKSQDYEAAMAHVDEGLQAIKGRQGQLLIAFKADLQLREKDFDGLRESIDKMRELGFRPQYIDWIEARILLAQGKWYEASEALSRLRADTENQGDLTAQINFQLGFCYERLGRSELARDTYSLVLQLAPDNEPAAAGMQRVLAKLGKQSPKVETEGEEASLQQRIAAILSKPKDEQDWTAFDEEIKKLMADREMDEVSQKLMWAQLYLARGELNKSRDLLQEAHKIVPEDQTDQRRNIQRLAIKLVANDPEQGPEKALPLLERVITQFGDRPELRLDKADILLAQRGEKLTEKLTALMEGIDDWTDDQKLVLWDGLASRFLSMGMSNEAKVCLKHVVDLQPENLPARRMLFLLALDTNDDIGMQEAQEKILEIIKDKSDSLWQFTEARRMLSLYRRGRLGEDALPEIRLLLQKAMDQRPDWHDLYVARAELELVEGNQDAAMEDFARAEQLGPVAPGARLILIRLLVSHGQYKEAKQQADEFPEVSRVRVLGQLYPEILLNIDDVEVALDAARELIASNPDNAENQLWFGKFVVQAVNSGSFSGDMSVVPPLLNEAKAAAERSTQLNPESSDAWIALLTIQVLSDDVEGANQTLCDAQLALSEDRQQLFLARGYEILGRWFDAENMYTTALEANPDDYSLMQMVATFYLGRSYPLKDGLAKATPRINRILRSGAEGALPPNDSNLQWARRIAATLLAKKNSYPDLIKAEKLLSSNAQQGKLTKDDRLAMARLLAIRPEPVSRVKAVKLLESVKQDAPLSSSDELALGKLYFGLNMWTECRNQMLDTISRYRNWSVPRKAYIHMLVQRGSSRELDDAEAQFKVIRELKQDDLETFELAVRLMTKRGRTDSARAALMKVMPKIDDPKEITDDQAKQLETIARLLVDLKDFDQAEKIYRLLAAYDSKRVLNLAGFLGRYRDPDQCFAVLEEAYKPERTSDIVSVALDTERLQRETIGDKYDAIIQQWLDRALRENPGMTELLILQAEFFNLQERFEDAVANYQKLLKDPNLKGPKRAIVLNNLSFMIALLGDKAQTNIDALKLVQEAVQLLGPTDAILDTRAVVNTAQGNYDRAIEDLELSIADEPTAAKYFHLVAAHLGAGQNQAALQAWDKAMELGLSVQDLDYMELGSFDTIKAKIDQLRPQSSTAPDAAPLSAAG